MRIFAPVPAPEMQIGGSLEDTLVLVPRVFTTDGSSVYWFDHGDYRLKAVDLESRQLRWTWGRRGDGPEELRNPWQVVLDPANGGIWVVDAGNARASLVRNGELLREVPLRTDAGMVARLLPLTDLHLATTFDSDVAFAADFGNLAEGAIAFHDSSVASLDPVLRQSLVATHGEQWAVVFVFSGEFALYRGRDFGCRGRTPVGIPLDGVADAEVPASGRRTAYSGGIALTDSLVFIMARSDNGEALSVLDMFGVRDCAYTGSVEFDQPIRGLAASADRVIVSFDEPVPRLVVYRAGSLAPALRED